MSFTPLVLKYPLSKESAYQATFLQGAGMNLCSFKRGDIEVIDQSTEPSFKERFAGLGPLIGPHFHRNPPHKVPHLTDTSLFPHIERCLAKGILDPFSHGIGRYAPWKAQFNENSIQAELSGKDQWNGIPLSQLEGQNFSMKMRASLSQAGLALDLSVVSDTDSLVGIHYYLHLPQGKGRVISKIKDTCYINGKVEKVPSEWGFNGSDLRFELDKAADYTFFPSPNPLHSDIFLETENYRLKVSYQSICQENSWQLYHPVGSSFVCIEPVSAQDPRHPNLTVSSISIQLQIEDI